MKAMEGLVRGSLGSSPNYRDCGSPEETDDIGSATLRLLPICIPSAGLKSHTVGCGGHFSLADWLPGEHIRDICWALHFPVGLRFEDLIQRP